MNKCVWCGEHFEGNTPWCSQKCIFDHRNAVGPEKFEQLIDQSNAQAEKAQVWNLVQLVIIGVACYLIWLWVK